MSAMETLKGQEEGILLFHNLDQELEDELPAFVRTFNKGEFIDIIHSSECEAIFSDVLSASFDVPLNELLEKAAQKFLDVNGSDPQQALYLLTIGAASLCAWVQHAQCGPLLPEDCLGWVLARRGLVATEEAAAILENPAHGDVAGVITQPLLLLFAKATLRPLAQWAQLQTGFWWCMRAVFVHQLALGEPNQALHEQLSALLEQGPPILAGSNSATVSASAKDMPLLWLEAARVHLWYGHVVLARNTLEKAREAVGVSMNLVGALGRRTHYQEKDVAQLTLSVEVEESSRQLSLRIGESLPKDVRLNDDVRFERIQFTHESESPALASLSPEQQSVVVATFSLVQRSQPRDNLAYEELLPYLQVVLNEPQLWSVQLTALLLRSRLECRQRRLAERAMCQLEELVSAVKSSAPHVCSRLRGIWALPLPLLTEMQCDLANILVQLGCVQNALDIFLELRHWESAVTCYNLLNLRHKAAELLRQEMAVRETVPLLCLLGDATDDPSQYERAWELSEQRSSRAQKHWGMHHFRRKEYAESIPHLQLSLSCNSLQPELWRRLGYAALDAENWALCASAYRRCVELDPENMEAWNNLAKAYVKTGQKSRAWYALQEALKADFENWRLWDNVAAVSADIGAFDEVVRAYHRLLDLQSGRHVDVPVLRALVCAITKDMRDSEGRGASRIRPQALALFGRITSQVTTEAEVWQLYAELTASLPEQTPQILERTAQYLQRAHRAATQLNSWAKQRDSCRKTLAVTSLLADAYLICSRARPDPQRLLSSARLSLRGVLTAVKQQMELAAELSSDVEELEKKLICVEDALRDLQQP